jgi:hypothetical protein
LGASSFMRSMLSLLMSYVPARGAAEPSFQLSSHGILYQLGIAIANSGSRIAVIPSCKHRSAKMAVSQRTPRLRWA